MSERVDRWKTAWESLDPDRVAALYRPDAAHASALVARIFPEAGGPTLRGRDRIREYASRGLSRFTELRFEILSVTESESTSAVEYHRHSNLDRDTPAHVLELIDWDGPAIRSVRVFHF
ncbi:MAG: nuclear transport factor 2 family protein [Candidatus Binatia bacterium]